MNRHDQIGTQRWKAMEGKPFPNDLQYIKSANVCGGISIQKKVRLVTFMDQERALRDYFGIGPKCLCYTPGWKYLFHKLPLNLAIRTS